ncbi:MAG: DUF6491 family protein [Steroidobacteraceae bacterium]
MNRFTVLCAAAAMTAAAAAYAGDPKTDTDAKPPPDRAQINFVNYGGIRDWKAQRNDALLIRAQNGKYYRATFFGPCIGLDFAHRIGFVSDVLGSLDKFSSIYVDGHECFFRTFQEIPKPDKW